MLRERHQRTPEDEITNDGGGDGGGLDSIRESGQAFLQAGDDAIRRALSGDSEQFLQANRQMGGQ